MIGALVVMATSFKRTYTRTIVSSAPDPTTELYRHTPSPETAKHTQASKAQPLVESLLLPPGSWCAQGFVCILQGCLFTSPVELL